MPDIQSILFEESFSYGSEILTFNSGGGDIYIISDLHLAAGVNSNDNYEGTENFMADFSFARLIKKLSASPENKKHVLVINGDVIDFLRITSVPATPAELERWQSGLAAIGIIKSTDELSSSISSREKDFGLGTEDFKSVWKLMIAAKGHQPVIDSLAAWIGKGHQLLITKGNHDLEWYWKAVRDALKIELCRSIHATRGTDLRIIASSIITPLVFFADQGVIIDQQIYCEHGHRFERFTTVDGPPLLDNQTQLNLPFGSFFNRYLINKIELAYPYIDNIRPRQQILPILLRERFPLAIKMLFKYLPLTIRVIPKKQYKYAFYYLFQFLMIVALPVAITIYAVIKTYHAPTAAPGALQTTILSALKNLVFLSLSYFIGRLFSWLELSGPSSLAPFLKDILKTSQVPSIVTFGHTHNPEKMVTTANQFYFNTGTWMPVFEADSADIRIDKTFTILCLTRAAGGRFTGELARWNDDAARLDTLPLTERK